MLLIKLFMDTKKLLPRAGANPGFGDGGAEFMVSAERQLILGILGHRPSGISGQRWWGQGAKPPEADELSANDTLIS